MRFPSQAQKKTRKFRFQIEDIGIIFQRLPSQAKKKTTEIPFSNRRYWHYFPEVPITSPKKGKSRFQIEDIGIIFHRFPSQAQKDTEIPSSNEVPITSPEKSTEIPFSNRRYWHYFPEVPITSPNKQRKSRFQIEDIGIIFQKSPKRHGNPVFKRGSHHKPRKKHGNSVFKQKILAFFSRGCHHKPNKTTEIPFSNRRYWHYFSEVPITSPKKGKSRFQIEDIGIIFQRFPSQAQKDTEIQFSNEVPITSPEKTRKFRFQIEDIGIIFQRLPSQAKYKQRKSRFQIEAIGIIFQRLPSHAQKQGNPVFKQKILALFSRGSHHKPKKREIPFSNEVPITSPEKNTKKSVFKQKIMALFSRGSHHKPKKREIPFSNRRYWHYFPEKPKKTRKSRFQMRFPSQAKKKHGNPVFKQKILALFSRGFHHKPKKTRKSSFQIEDIGIIFQRFPSQAQKKHGNSVFKQKILALFSRCSHHKPKKNNGNPIFKQKILALFSTGSHHKPIKREIPFSNRRYWHYFPEKPTKTRQSRFQMRFPSQAQKKTRKIRFQIEDIGIIFQKSQKRHGNPVFK